MADSQPTIGNFTLRDGEAAGTKTKTLRFSLPGVLKPAASCTLTFDASSDENRIAKSVGILTTDKSIFFPGGVGGSVEGWTFTPDFHDPCNNPAGISECEMFGELTGNWTGEYTKCRVKFKYTPNCDPHVNLTSYSASSPCSSPTQYGPHILPKSYFFFDIGPARKIGLPAPNLTYVYVDGTASTAAEYGPGNEMANQREPLSCTLECLNLGEFEYIKLCDGNPAESSTVEAVLVQYGFGGPTYAYVRESFTGGTFSGIPIGGKIVEADAEEIYGCYRAGATPCDYGAAYPENYYSLGYYLDATLTVTEDSTPTACVPLVASPFSGSDTTTGGFEICEGGNMVANWVHREFDVTLTDSITIIGKRAYSEFTATFDVSVTFSKNACDTIPTHVISCSCTAVATRTCTYDGPYDPVQVLLGEITFECSNRKISVYATPNMTETFPGSGSIRGVVRVIARLGSA